jgi:hypothetical protein
MAGSIISASAIAGGDPPTQNQIAVVVSLTARNMNQTMATQKTTIINPFTQTQGFSLGGDLVRENRAVVSESIKLKLRRNCHGTSAGSYCDRSDR